MYLPVPFFLDEALQICELCLQSQCPCCNECAARKVLSISSVTSCFVNVFSRLKADTFLSCSHVVTCKVEDIFRHSVMLGYIVWSISFKIADAVIRTVLGSCCSHFLCHKVILASRSKGEGNESLGMWKTGQRKSSMFLLMPLALTEQQIGTALLFLSHHCQIHFPAH